ncbi:MAG: glutamine synthetase beta-grasp domain-containing protein [Candidatus Micrarchaeota archaeon]
MSGVDEVLKYIATNEIKWIDLQFFDIKGFMHRTTISNKQIDDKLFEKGIDAADLTKVFGKSEQGELVLVPDPDTMARIPWEPSTIRFLCDVRVADKNERFLKDSRYVAERTESNIEAIGAKSMLVGADVEFNIFDSATTDRTTPGRGGGTLIESREAPWSPTTLAGFEKGSFIATPFDTMYGARAQIAETMEESFGVTIDGHRHGRSKMGQQMLDIQEYPVKMAADALTSVKYVARSLGNAVNASVTFMPYPIDGETGNSLNIHQSIWKASDKNVFYDGEDNYAQISQTARYYIGGILEHTPALTFLTNPTTNSYRRLAADPKTVGWSKEDRNAVVRVPTVKKNYKETKRITYTLADPSVNPHLAYSAIIAAGLDGVKNKIEPGYPTESSKESKKKKIELPMGLYQSIEAFGSDSKFLKGLVPKEIVEELVDLKYEEIKNSSKSIPAWEMAKYFNI